MKTKIGQGGYPDMGSGRYSEALSYKDWYLYNNSQRVQYNYLEHLVCINTWTLIAGFYQPVIAAIFGFVYFFGRIIYSIGDVKSP